jgi:phosphatidylethanolamine-binding protein (PEBP) family uncharacterized protein
MAYIQNGTLRFNKAHPRGTSRIRSERYASGCVAAESGLAMIRRARRMVPGAPNGKCMRPLSCIKYNEEASGMKIMRRVAYALPIVTATSTLAIAQNPPAKAAPAARSGFWVTSQSWSDDAEIPMRHVFRGENKSPAFEFHWSLGTSPASPPETLKTYAVIFHDAENSTSNTPTDTLHRTLSHIPGGANRLPEGLGAGDLPYGTCNGPGLGARAGNPPAYFGPVAGLGPLHHHVFEFYALDTKLDLPANVTREDLVKAMDGHVVGKSAWFERFHTVVP